MSDCDSRRLIKDARNGDEAAAQALLRRYRERLKRMISVYLDPRVRQRLDESDVVQETLVCAAQRLDEFDPSAAGGFYPWLRQIARERIIDAHRRHVGAGKRSVTREEPNLYPDAAESTSRLVNHLVSAEESPSAHFETRERHKRLRYALDQLSDQNRELLVMRFFEQMRPREIASVLSISEAAVKSRLCRALAKLTLVINDGEDEQR